MRARPIAYWTTGDAAVEAFALSRRTVGKAISVAARNAHGKWDGGAGFHCGVSGVFSPYALR